MSASLASKTFAHWVMGRRRDRGYGGYGGSWDDRWEEPRLQWVKAGQAHENGEAFILGRGGKTKHKIASARLELHERNNTVEVTGSEEAICCSVKLFQVQAQRVGPVHVDNGHDDGDLTMMDVPNNCVAFVTGSGGNFLRACEEAEATPVEAATDWLMLSASAGLAIFGPPWGRAGAELKIMAAIEAKLPGHYTSEVGDVQAAEESLPDAIVERSVLDQLLPQEGWAIDTMPLTGDELSFALGKEGATRRKLANASGCILEYIGNIAYMAGVRAERQRDYITWLKQQRIGPVYIDISSRSDATEVKVPRELTGILKGTTLRDIEHETDTFCFLEGDVDSSEELFNGHGSYGRDLGCNNDGQQLTKAEIRTGQAICASLDKATASDAMGFCEKLQAIQQSCGARLTQQGTDNVLIQGYAQQVNLAAAKKQLQEYIFSLRVDEVKQAEKKIILSGIFSVVSNARKDLQTFLSSFVTHEVHLKKEQLEKVSALGKAVLVLVLYCLNNFRHLVMAQINKEQLKLTLSGAPDAVNEARAEVDGLFEKQGWPIPSADLFAAKHSMSRSSGASKPDAEGGEKVRREGGKTAEILQLTDMDSAFILGRGGKTKHKIARVSGATLELHEHNCTVEIIGAVRAQRVGPVHVTPDQHDDGERFLDLTMIPVPTSCVGFVTGSQGNFLRTCEEEWGTLMFFCDYQGPGGSPGDSENLAIFGARAGRTGAELKVMAAIEAKLPYFYTKNITDHCCPDEWGRDTIPLGDEELSFALGKDGATRKKLAKASGCMSDMLPLWLDLFQLEGAAEQKAVRAREYLGWLLKQRTGTVYVDTHNRNDVTIVDIPHDLEAVASVFKSMTLRGIEQETKTFCFLEGNSSKSERLLIFGHDKAGREKAKAVALAKIDERYRNDDDGGWGGKYGWSNQGDRHYGGWQEPLEVSDSFLLRGDISVHAVMIQTGPNGEDPVIEVTWVNLSDTCEGMFLLFDHCRLMKEKAMIQIQGTSEKVGQAEASEELAKRQLQQFADRITAALANKVSHYIRPMPWISSAEVEVIHELYRDHGLELDDADVTIKRRDEQPSHHSGGQGRTIVSGRAFHAAGRDCDVLRVSEDDAAFILGRGGKTKHKIARVSAAQLELHERNSTVEIYGSDNEARARARKYIDLVRAQRVGPVHVDESHDDGETLASEQESTHVQDLTLIAVPSFVTGSQGNFLRTCEEALACDLPQSDKEWKLGHVGREFSGLAVKKEKLAIFGTLWARCGAELKVMAAIETKLPGFYTTNLGETQSWDEPFASGQFDGFCNTHDSDELVRWGTDTYPMHSDQLSYVLGRKGSTRQKLAKASGGFVAIAG
ncbi:hypothetical protein AK812_SmicGene35431 [Symbiodinium microadriaticum]|uniref:K Homology domain-containing protein n=1 Tax=Symbiodinium microadriaticum TaxID=2951 RepID=A0A1Q9CLG6_SYMMI|nr:hypothetical protein AK812_SmicGene35431 [Symbiodinium microadriaticum]